MTRPKAYVDRKRLLLKSERLFSKSAEALRRGKLLIQKSKEMMAESDRAFIEQARLPYYNREHPSDDLLWQVAVARMDVMIVLGDDMER